ncbi:MAG: VWA domain-containing protein [Candidatus Levybacteria bacterium]|nr:VWA domain-containing protein [Candidatus Levybacteria bacterium]
MKLKKKKSTKSIFSSYSKGLPRASGDARRGKAGKSSVYIVLIMVIILGSIIFAQGIFPKSTITNPPNNEEGTIVSEAPKDEKYNLQLDTIKFQKCGETAAVDFLIDSSGSMAFGTKLENLKSALLTFADKFPPNGVTAMQLFSVYPFETVKFDYFKNNKTSFINAVNAMYPISATHTKDAFNFVKPIITNAKNKYKDKKIALVFISDGVPETGANNNACPGGQNSDYCGPNPLNSQACRCFDTNQDPTQPASEIKNAGIRIFSIGYISSEDDKFKEKLRTLMTNVASSPSDFYEAPITNQITEILKQITTKICNV